jgi:hypothetical protein
MKNKPNRHAKIKTVLRHQAHPSSITEIHEALIGRAGQRISRRTIERDLYELEAEDEIVVIGGIPVRFKLRVREEVQLRLRREEIELILALLDRESELFQKLDHTLRSNCPI